MKDYPYMCARVSAKKAKLYSDSEYKNLLKMQVNEISRKMEEGEYSTEINQLGSDFDGADLIERALNLNLSNTINHLVKISSQDAEPIIKAYTRRFDILNYKRILRWKQSGSAEKLENIIYPIDTIELEAEEIEEMSFEEIKNTIKFEDSPIDYQEKIQGLESTEEIERKLDQAYAEDLRKISSKTRSKEFKNFVKTELLYRDLKIMLRLKKHGLESSKIEPELTCLDDERIQGLLGENDYENVVAKVKEITGAEGETLEELEHSIEQERLTEALKTMHREPLGLSTVIGYIVAKEAEIENLRMIVRAKETGIKNREMIQKNLVLT